MYTLLKEKDIIETCTKTLAESEDPDKRRLSLLAIAFYFKQELDENDCLAEDQIQLFVKALEKDTDADVRMCAAWAIGYLWNEDTDAQNLIHGLNDEVARVRLETVHAIGFLYQYDRHGAVLALIQALADKDVTVRMHALGLLLEIDRSFVFGQIENLLDSVDAENASLLNE
jgi:HEAT repeat protein